ncbi:MAG: DoxX family membrane protein [Verrucomicrobiae bacterium]|nr:DoxX family membrane protein [Verrucomicrobiae bacterium]MDW8310337.1 MauE/DoxX family redox-associated membrane protein [Verrucomicrobiales bacterium]
MRKLVRWILGALLVWAALSKIANPLEFYSGVAAYQVPLPGFALRATAVVLPWLELICGLLLLAGLWTRAAAAWALVLFVVFTVATGQAWARGLEISCGCFNLEALGLGAGRMRPLVEMFESVGFAFVRAAVLALGAVYVLREGAARPWRAREGTV